MKPSRTYMCERRTLSVGAKCLGGRLRLCCCSIASLLLKAQYSEFARHRRASLLVLLRFRKDCF